MQIIQPLDLNQVLEALAASLDIPDQLYEEATARYDDVAEWLSAEDSALRDYSPDIYPQGSFRLGTMTRPFQRGDEFDIDLVCRLTIAKDRTTQKALKDGVGTRLKEHEELERIVNEKRRCWTLNYPGQFHLDVLPAIPNAEGAPESIWLADRELRLWQPSNPIDYANWFFEQMRVVLDEERGLVAKSAGVNIEDVPEWRVRTPLQRAVQLLKRHRDVHFTCEDENRPVSIIITTLAAKAYQQERDVETALRQIARKMPEEIECRNGKWWVENPAQPGENFADKWNAKPQRREVFLAWLKALEEDIGGALVAKSVSDGRQLLEERFGVRRPGLVAMAKSGGVLALHSENVPAPGDSSHQEAPRWPLQASYKCRVKGQVYKDRKRRKALWDLTDRPVSKEYALRFEAVTNVPQPFEVHWQVVNTGQEATRDNGLRGDFYESEGRPGVRWETTRYAGTHWVEAFVVKNGVCVARSGRKLVRIKARA